jgi:hypothetical protein
VVDLDGGACAHDLPESITKDTEIQDSLLEQGKEAIFAHGFGKPGYYIWIFDAIAQDADAFQVDTAGVPGAFVISLVSSVTS